MNKIIVLFSALLMTMSIEAKQKNVLFIAVDDLKPLMTCYGVEGVHTPNIDRIAKAGIVFENSHCQQAVCSPSRASLMFGVSPDKTKVWDIHTPVRTALKNEKTISGYFKENGYETVAFGKIFHISMADKKHDKPSWSIDYDKVNITNYPKVTGEPIGGHFQNPELKKQLEQFQQELINKGEKIGKARSKALAKFKQSTECMDVPDEAYLDGQIALNAVNMIKALANKGKPFFIAAGFKKPHLPFVAPKEYWDLYDRDEIELSKWQKAPDNAPSFAMHTWGELKSYAYIEPAINKSGLLEEAKQRELIHGYLASVSYTDAQIGKLLDELEKQGVEDETIVVLWGDHGWHLGDHGWHLGDHGLWCKHSNFEQATRSPLLFASPEFKGGLKNASPVEFLDIYPTLCDLADLPIPEGLDGKSLVPIMAGKKQKVKDFAISQYHRGDQRMGYSLRNERYRYTAWMDIKFREGEKPTPEKVIADELYDYLEDPNETKNRINESSYNMISQELKQLLFNHLEN